MLTFLILSNAYKGENINKITSPLSPVVYDSLQDLVKNNFSIYGGIVSNDPIYGQVNKNTYIDLKVNEQERNG